MLQYFLPPVKSSIFERDRLPQLLYICNTETMKQNFPRVLHKHDDHLEIVFIVKGNGTHVVGNKTYTTQAGDLVIFNPNVVHDEMAACNSNMVVYCCGISELSIKGQEKNTLFDETVSAVIQTGEKREIIRNLLHLMFLHVKENAISANEICRYLLAALITVIIQLTENIPPLTYNRLTLIEQVRHYIDLHYAEDITLNSLARRFHINSYYLAHLFKRQTAFSPIQYLIRRRIGEAQSMLINTDHSIGYIATAVGYDNTNYFSRLFTRMIDISPSQYRISWIGKNKP
ncbi:AraC family transcriptional regulator [Pasteurellaceae bacterium LIM206]|nr:AraC family transcriptional regulator [Pasteurellaceae bacterium LIM206]